VELRQFALADAKRTNVVQKTIPKGRAAEVVTSVKKVGIACPPRIDASGQVILGGAAMWAAQKNGEVTAMVLVEDHEVCLVESLRLQLADAVQRVPLRLTEEVAAVERLMELEQCGASKVSESVGLDDARISKQRKIVAELEAEVVELIDNGTVPFTVGYALTFLAPEKRAELLPRLRRGTVTRDEVVALRSGKVQEAIAASPCTGKRLTAVLDGGRAVTVLASDLTMDGFIDTLREVLKRAQRAQARGVDLKGFARALRAESKAATV
jgi:hypothetical protein